MITRLVSAMGSATLVTLLISADTLVQGGTLS